MQVKRFNVRHFTTISIIAGLSLVILWPFFLSDPPVNTSENKQRLAAYALRFSLYLMATILCLCASVVGAILVARKAREEFAEEAARNLKQLIEGTIQDHANRSE